MVDDRVPRVDTARPSGKRRRRQCLLCLLVFLQLFVHILLLHSHVKTESEAGDSIRPQGWDVFALETRRSSKRKSSIEIQNIWDNSTILPQWMKDYFAWHKEQRYLLNRSNWEDFRFIVMRCLDVDSHCGGTSDRLKPVPLILHWAAKSKRILMIYWNRPANLEEFLLPPEGGMDWIVPAWLVPEVVHGSLALTVDAYNSSISNTELDRQVAVRTRVQCHFGGEFEYNANVEGPSFAEVYRDVWNTLFTPSLPIKMLIRNQLDHFNLHPGKYVSVHLRGLYAINDRPRRRMLDMAENALNCATNLIPTGPIYFASDSKMAVDFVAQEFAPTRKYVTIVATQRQYEPLHLEDKNWRNRTASDYYDTFLDLFLLALAKCVTYNVGGYGRFSLFISGTNCSKPHGKQNRILRCQWSGKEMPRILSIEHSDELIFFSPIKGINDTEQFLSRQNNATASQELTQIK